MVMIKDKKAQGWQFIKHRVQ